jgi:hypothetical protein
MFKVKCLVRVLGVALMVAWGVNEAGAAFVTYTVGDGGLSTFSVSIDNKAAVNALVGSIKLTEVGDNPAMPNTYYTVCTDIEGVLFLGRNYGFTQPTVFSGQTGIKPTWGATSSDAAAAIQNAAHLFFTHQSVLASGSQSEKAALQLAVWEALYDTGGTIGLGSGRFQATGADAAALGLATTWLQTDLTGNYSYAGFLLTPDPTEQYGYPGQGVLIDVTPVPEPTTMIAGALLLIPFGLSTVRFLRRKRVS